MRRSDGKRAKLGALGEHPVLGRRLAEDVDPLALDQLQALGGIEAGVVDHRRGPAEPRSDEDVARRLRPAGRRRAPDELALPGPEPVLGLGPLAGQVALGVQRPARLAGRPRGEDDQGAVVGPQVGDSRGGSWGRSSSITRATSAIVIAGTPSGSSPSSSSSPTQSTGVRGAAPAARGRGGEAACCRAGRSRPSASRPASPAPTRSGCRPGSSPRRRGPPRGPRTPPTARRCARSARRMPRLGARPSREIATSAGLRRREPLQHVLDEVHGRRSLPSVDGAATRGPRQRLESGHRARDRAAARRSSGIT